ncbi:MAG: bifunctional NADH-specific enoyl-ACP reductase/trans-2-enoyl-CoA reductase [Gammaproteobacteria bacterium]|nr:MAG: bifunctional NADH-specific enoyl-ACP reductase/trans-2-enoyl-CoA reductase [Gammaproteobacteria bacterium]RLA49448.1 MAG: bifunctional NADH-specific enoyl-ACP reductase/trans-2-enoyl-CoA reductase [Gammaproteobacteria bacterium]
MVIKPKVRGFICTNAHPVGCAAHVQEQIDYVKAKGKIVGGPKNVLVIGSSTGYGLASRITAAFGCGANTLGIFFEKPPTDRRTGSAGYYNSAALQTAARKEGLYAGGINGDAFSDEVKEQAIEMLKENMGPLDLVVYSLASPRRTDPRSGVTYESSLKPIGDAYTMKGVNTDTLKIDELTVEPATEEEIANTIKVMGGEDWEWWIDALADAGLLAEGCKTTAYTYIGEEMTWPLYGHASIGMAKKDLDRASAAIDKKLQAIGGESKVSVLKALVTQASSAIPIMPLYISILYKIMKEEGTHEGCIEQIQGLFERQLFTRGERDVDDVGRLRMDGLELKASVQAQVKALWDDVSTETLGELTDFTGYRQEFLKLFGFGVDGVDYDADVDILVEL